MGDADGHGCSCGDCCRCFCICVATSVCNWYTFLAAVALAAVLVAAFGVALPVRATVTAASLARLDIIDNGSLAYNVSLTVVLRNRN
ncbi:hypothetical protein BAE44_0024852 [Dichanthelium oligosanthes]|uniref:Late embryogenesis abundant protein LEA-2 subgroup domain-containing protein n=1 Tax=Dichanthelium oligosanthes TaxID=888268 RepID=A0A1E5UMT8_9POAL|nr:hypothetical protein BAE44_0024852 [Dichanthelium oligosanthes]